jgi:DNA-binding GntR family transcriptional regulator
MDTVEQFYKTLDAVPWEKDMDLDFTVRRTTAPQQVADGLSQLILSGHFGPGTRLRESAIAAELGVSRNTVREAVRILQLGGLVRYRVNKGAVVIAPTPEVVDGLYEARCQLEVAAVREPREAAELAPLRAAFARLATAADTLEVRDIVTADLDFHAAIVALLRSSRINAFYAELTTELRFYLSVLSMQDHEPHHRVSIVTEHAAILEAIESGRPVDAVRAVRTHVEDNARRVCDIVARETTSPTR